MIDQFPASARCKITIYGGLSALSEHVSLSKNVIRAHSSPFCRAICSGLLRQNRAAGKLFARVNASHNPPQVIYEQIPHARLIEYNGGIEVHCSRLKARLPLQRTLGKRRTIK
jgi:hypothetical protein